MKKVDRTRVHFIERCNPRRHTKDMTGGKKGSGGGREGGGGRGERN